MADLTQGIDSLTAVKGDFIVGRAPGEFTGCEVFSPDCENQSPTWVNDQNKVIEARNQHSNRNNAEFVKMEVHYPTNLQIANNDACT